MRNLHVLGVSWVLVAGLAASASADDVTPITDYRMPMHPVIHRSYETPGTYGIVRSVSGRRIRLTDARFVEMHDYTVIEPIAAPIRPGQKIFVRGWFSPDGSQGHPVIDARSIVITPLLP